ncbi:hypothetical protein M422DRAFT_22911 [Sphaerobolus stellatus SS14]|nr:hypothetical protein M422DRAFT_22911 [Sphaerobolus stellatus SS14]
MPFKPPSILLKEIYTPFISGKFLPVTTSRDAAHLIPVVNPGNGEHVTNVISTTSAEVKHAIDIAQEAFESGIWSKAPVQQRSVILSRLARSLESRIGNLATLESLQTGRAIREMKAQLGRLPEWDYYAALIRTHQSFIPPTQGKLLNYVTRVPLGVVAQITPFNHPLLIAVKKIAPALAMGNSVLVKPSEMAPISVLEFAEMTLDAGVPAGVLQVLPGAGMTTGMDLVSDPRIKKVDITAGTRTGRAIGNVVGRNLANYTAELGGKAPVVVFDDADLTGAVNGVAFASFIASGQTCVSGTRIIVQEGIYDRFMDEFLNKVRSITKRIGNPLNPESSMGSVISQHSLNRMNSMIERRKSGNLAIGGQQMTGLSPLDEHDLSQGSFYPPTIITDISTEDELWQKEIFGPVVVVKRFQDEQEGIQLANNCKYGLGAALWTKDLSRAHRAAAQIEAGLVWVNAHHRNDPSSPWGGMKESGIGRENGVEALEHYSQSKSVIINYASPEEIQGNEDWFAENTDETRRYG